MSHPCILCGGTETTIHKLGSATVRRALEEHFRSPLPGNVELKEYDMLECARCRFISALPMSPGDSEFYAWVTNQPDYYPAFRWEWGPVVERISRVSALAPISILDVGCGSGDFLSLIKDIPGVDAWGLDATTTSIETAKARGLQAICADMQKFLALEPAKKFDFVTSFHCLEHVDNPVSFMRDIKHLLKLDGGVAWISAPLSPMSHEHSWFDPLNHPPHHMSRWSMTALNKLAEVTGLNVSLTSSPARSNIRRAARALMLAKTGRLDHKDPIHALIFSLRHFPDFLREWSVQSRRPRIDGRREGDTFLAAFTRPSSLRNRLRQPAD